MSIDATRWAYQQTTGSSARKAVLVSMADRCGEDHTCYPSIARLAKDTELNEKTVRKAIHDLCEMGLIQWTGETRGLGARVYKLLGVNDRHQVSTHTKIGSTNFNTPTNLGSTKNGSTPLPILDVPPTNLGSTPLPKLGVKPINEPTINLSSESSNEKEHALTYEKPNFKNSQSEQNLVSEKSISESHLQNRQYQSIESGMDSKSTCSKKINGSSNQKLDIKPPVKIQDLIDLGVSPQVAHDFLRKKKNHEITHTALVRNQNQAKKANLTLAQALEFTVEKDWQAFTADYYFNAIRSQNAQGFTHANHQPSNQPQQFDTGTTFGYASKLTADAQAYYAQQAAQQRADRSNPIDVHCVEGTF